MDLTTAVSVITEGWTDSVASDLLVLGGTDGLTHTGNYQINGLVALGAAIQPNINLYLSATLTSGASQYGMISNPVSTSAATTLLVGVNAAPIQAGSITTTQVASFQAGSPIKGSGSTITSAYGILIDPITSGNTNNYGLYVGGGSGGSGTNAGIYVSSGGIVVANGGVTVGTLPVAVVSNGSRNRILTGVCTSGSVANNTATNVTVTFGVTFTSVPDVQLSIADSSDLSTINLWGLSRQSISTTNMNVQFLNRTGSTQSLFASWTAVGGA